jgi:hypothetical protein
MKFKFWPFVFLGTISLVSLASNQALAEGSQSVVAQAPSASPAASSNASPAEEVAPILPTPDSEALAQNAPILPTPDSEAASIAATDPPVTPEPVYRRDREASSESYPVASTSEEAYNPSPRDEAPAEAVDYASNSNSPEGSVPAGVDNAAVGNSGSVDGNLAQTPKLAAVETPDRVSERHNVGKRESNSKKLAKKVSLGDLTFVCSEVNGTPQTSARLDKKELGVILWTSTVFASKGYNPETRCKQVSARFEAYRANSSLYLTTGKVNGQPVMCFTSKEDGGCGDGIASNEGMLFTLKPQINGDETVKQLAGLLTSESNTPMEPLKE